MIPKCEACAGKGWEDTGIGQMLCDDCAGTGLNLTGLEARITELEALSVTHILLEVVPGYDGMGLEVYARSVDDVVRVLTHRGELIEGLFSEREQLKAKIKQLEARTPLPEGNFQADLHKVAKLHLDKRRQGYFMGAIRQLLLDVERAAQAKEPIGSERSDKENS